MWRNRLLALVLSVPLTLVGICGIFWMLANIPPSARLTGAEEPFYVMIVVVGVLTLIMAYVVLRALFSDKWES